MTLSVAWRGGAVATRTRLGEGRVDVAQLACPYVGRYLFSWLGGHRSYICYANDPKGYSVKLRRDRLWVVTEMKLKIKAVV